MKQIKIIQASPGHTGSTLLTNLLYGFLIPNEGVFFSNDSIVKKLVTKTHTTNIDWWEKKYSKQYDMYFIMSERKDEKVTGLINDKYRNRNDVLIIKYEDLIDDNVINIVFEKLLHFLPKNIIPKKSNDLIIKDMKNRIEKMNKICKEMENQSFKKVNTFTHIHGGHKNRKLSIRESEAHNENKIWDDCKINQPLKD